MKPSFFSRREKLLLALLTSTLIFSASFSYGAVNQTKVDAIMKMINEGAMKFSDIPVTGQTKSERTAYYEKVDAGLGDAVEMLAMVRNNIRSLMGLSPAYTADAIIGDVLGGVIGGVSGGNNGGNTGNGNNGSATSPNTNPSTGPWLEVGTISCPTGLDKLQTANPSTYKSGENPNGYQYTSTAGSYYNVKDHTTATDTSLPTSCIGGEYWVSPTTTGGQCKLSTCTTMKNYCPSGKKFPDYTILDSSVPNRFDMAIRDYADRASTNGQIDVGAALKQLDKVTTVKFTIAPWQKTKDSIGQFGVYETPGANIPFRLVTVSRNPCDFNPRTTRDLHSIQNSSSPRFTVNDTRVGNSPYDFVPLSTGTWYINILPLDGCAAPGAPAGSDQTCMTRLNIYNGGKAFNDIGVRPYTPRPQEDLKDGLVPGDAVTDNFSSFPSPTSPLTIPPINPPVTATNMCPAGQSYPDSKFGDYHDLPSRQMFKSTDPTRTYTVEMNIKDTTTAGKLEGELPTLTYAEAPGSLITGWNVSISRNPCDFSSSSQTVVANDVIGWRYYSVNDKRTKPGILNLAPGKWYINFKVAQKCITPGKPADSPNQDNCGIFFELPGDGLQKYINYTPTLTVRDINKKISNATCELTVATNISGNFTRYRPIWSEYLPEVSGNYYYIGGSTMVSKEDYLKQLSPCGSGINVGTTGDWMNAGRGDICKIGTTILRSLPPYEVRPLLPNEGCTALCQSIGGSTENFDCRPPNGKEFTGI